MPPLYKAMLNIFVSLNTVLEGIIYAASFPVILFICSCGSTVKQKENKKADSTALIQLPAPVPLTRAEMDHYWKACQAWYDSTLKTTGFNGGIIVAKKGNIVFENYMGSAHFDSTDTINSQTSFHIASVSKTFTAMAMLKLQQEGKLNIDDELVKYFPRFNYPGVTIRTLLNHRSGLPNYIYFFESIQWDQNKIITNKDVLDYLIAKKQEFKDISPPNTRFAYCNTNYALLALLIEKVTGQQYSEYLQQTFFKPLQMQQTFVYDTTMKDKVNMSYNWQGELIEMNYLDAVYGDKNIYSTPHDLLIWDKALYCCTIFTDTTLSEAYMPYSNEKPGIRNYGLGWRMNVYPNNKKMILHTGWWHGNNSIFIRLIEDSATIIVLGNKHNRNIYRARELAQLFGDYFGGGGEDEALPVKNDTTNALSKILQTKNKKMD